MTHRISTEISINAEPAEVWEVLTDFDSYSSWNPFIVQSSGVAKVGETLLNKIQAPKGKATVFKPIVTKAVDNSNLEWLGKLGVKGLFDGRHSFQLEFEPSSGTTKLIHSEEFSGALVRFFKKSLDTKVKEGFVSMNEALKDRVEKSD